jgi:hypothetical protein
MAFRIDQYSRKATRDVRGAMAMALRRHLEGLHFADPRDFVFAEVFEEWPSFLERYIPPSCCILPGTTTYADALMTPTLLEDTWEPSGEQGFGLYQLSEIDLSFEVYIRCASVTERNAVMLGIEESFRAPLVLMDMVAGARNAILKPLPEYYNLDCRFSVTAARTIDDQDTSVREARDAIFSISAQAPQVTVGPVYPMNSTVTILYPIVIVPPSALPFITFDLTSSDLAESGFPFLMFGGPGSELDEDDNPVPPPM